MARRAPVMERPHDALQRAIAAHRAIVDPDAAAELEAQHEQLRAKVEQRRERRRAQPRDRKGKFS